MSPPSRVGGTSPEPPMFPPAPRLSNQLRLGIGATSSALQKRTMGSALFPTVVHGTLSRCQDWGCRCLPCRVARAAYWRRYYARQKAAGRCPRCRRVAVEATVCCRRCRARARRAMQRSRLARQTQDGTGGGPVATGPFTEQHQQSPRDSQVRRWARCATPSRGSSGLYRRTAARQRGQRSKQARSPLRASESHTTRAVHRASSRSVL